MLIVQCIKCGALIHKPPSEIKRAKYNFCSRACKGAYFRIPLSASCAQCGKLVYKLPIHVKRYKNVFCSRACQHARMRTGHITPEGYRLICIDGKQVREHRFIMERHLGRKLLPTEHVHHRNRDRADNRLSNLTIMNLSAHMREHHPLTWDLNQAITMRAEGYTFEKIAEFFGVTSHVIHKALVRRGLHTSKPRRKPRR